MPLKAMRQQISSAVDLIVQVNRLPGGPRKVTGDHRNHGDGTRHHHHAGHFQVLVLEGVNESGRGVGRFEATGIRPSFIPPLRVPRRQASWPACSANESCCVTRRRCFERTI